MPHHWHEPCPNCLGQKRKASLAEGGTDLTEEEILALPVAKRAVDTVGKYHSTGKASGKGANLHAMRGRDFIRENARVCTTCGVKTSETTDGILLVKTGRGWSPLSKFGEAKEYATGSRGYGRR